MLTDQQLAIIKTKLAPFDPIFLGLFGSYARNEEREDSDLDLLVEFGKKINLLELINLEQQLKEALGIKVDLVTKRALSKHIKGTVEKEVITIMNRPYEV